VNHAGSNFCSGCGTPLAPRPKSGTGWNWLLVLLILGFGIYLYHRVQGPEPKKPASEFALFESASPVDTARDAASRTPASRKPSSTWPPSAAVAIPVGTVTINDITGNPIAQVTAPVLGDGWVALPVRMCIGGYEWVLEIDSERNNIIEGILSDWDDVGLWRIQDGRSINGPDIHPWNAGQPLTWISVGSNHPPRTVQLDGLEEQGHFLKAPAPAGLDEPGVFVQQGRVVGWSFGGVAAGAYLWAGEESKYLIANYRVDDFYRATFADSREEELTRALAAPDDYTDLERLQALANAFRFEAKLSELDTPEHLRAETAVTRIRMLINRLSVQDYAREVADAFDAQVLIEAADEGLVTDVAFSVAAGYDYEDAILLTETVIEGGAFRQSEDSQKLEQLLSRLYSKWLDDLLGSNDLQGGWQAYERGRRNVPNDLKIYLYGVRLALAENDWENAERRLMMETYPPSLADEVQDLQARISKLKGQVGKIVVRFSPNTSYIPLTATLGRTVQQKFVVDTGATLVTIPNSTAIALGLSVDGVGPKRRVHTAGGVRIATEVILPSISIDGWEVYDIRALVLDLPGQPGLGLLGMSYLENFRMDLNAPEGSLVLEPR